MGAEATQVCLAFQDDLRAVLQQIGGYWRPLAATARLLEELGELAEQLERTQGGRHRAGLDEELADLWIISTALADQFCVRVPKVPQPAGGDSLSACFMRALQHAGHIARAVNHYDGPKTPRSMDSWIPLSRSIPDLHTCLVGLAALLDCDLEAAIDEKLKRIPARDGDRFAAAYDPALSPVLERFSRVCAEARCPFSNAAKLWGAPAWSDAGSVSDNARAISDSLERFCKACDPEALDGYVIGLGPGPRLRALDGVARALGELLGALAEADPLGADCLRGPIEVKGWQFEFAGTRLFTTVHSELYDPSHVRYSSGGTFVLFQPEGSFSRHGIGSAHAGSQALRRRIRAAFAPASYPNELIDQRIEAHLYLLSESVSEPGYLRWWDHARVGRSSE